MRRLDKLLTKDINGQSKLKEKNYFSKHAVPNMNKNVRGSMVKKNIYYREEINL